MSLSRLEKLAAQAKRMQEVTALASTIADSTDETLTSFEENLKRMHAARLKVREHDNQISAMLKVMGNFNMDEVLGADPKTPLPPPAPKLVTDLNGVTLNPDSKK